MSPVLIVGPSWVGDMVMAQSLFKLLRAVDPTVEIDVLAPEWSRPLLARMPEVRDAHTMPLGHGRLGLGERYRLGKSLRPHRYRQAILLPNSLKSALVPFWADIPVRTGFIGEMRYGLLNDLRKLDKQALTMTVQRFAALSAPADTPAAQWCLDNIPKPALTVDAEGVSAARRAMGLESDAPVLALCPGAEYGPAKRWPADYFAQVARHYIEQGWQVWVFGSEKDSEPAQLICDAVGEQCYNLAGRTSLEQAIDLMSAARVVVSNDSGLMHVAAALGCAVVAVYGSSDPGFTPPLSDKAQVLSLGLECSPCFKRECPFGHTDCLYNLKPEQVIEAVAGLAEQSA